MEPISAAASVFGAIGFIGTVAAAASSFMRDFRSARKEIVAIKKELASLRAVLEILAEDFDDPANTSLHESVHERIVDAATNCSRVLHEIDDCIRGLHGSRISWVNSGKEEICNLQRKLEAEKSALSVTLDYVSV